MATGLLTKRQLLFPNKWFKRQPKQQESTVVSEMSYGHFRCVLWVTQTNPATKWKGSTQGLNTPEGQFGGWLPQVLKSNKTCHWTFLRGQQDSQMRHRQVIPKNFPEMNCRRHPRGMVGVWARLEIPITQPYYKESTLCSLWKLDNQCSFKQTISSLWTCFPTCRWGDWMKLCDLITNTYLHSNLWCSMFHAHFNFY